VALAECGDEVGEVIAIDARGGGEAVGPRVEDGGLVYGEGFVGAEGWVDAGGEGAIVADFAVMLEGIDRVIGAADGDYAAEAENAARGHAGLGEAGIGLLPDGGGGVLVEEIGYAEVVFQLEMGPMVEGIADEAGDGAGVGEEFLPRGGAAGAKVLGDAVCAHGTPFVVIAGEPYLGEIGEAVVLCYEIRGEMAVVVQYGLRRGVGVVKGARGVRPEEKVRGDERHAWEVMLGQGGRARNSDVVLRRKWLA
jgi:hypothetical protein